MTCLYSWAILLAALSLLFIPLLLAAGWRRARSVRGATRVPRADRVAFLEGQILIFGAAVALWVGQVPAADELATMALFLHAGGLCLGVAASARKRSGQGRPAGKVSDPEMPAEGRDARART